MAGQCPEGAETGLALGVAFGVGVYGEDTGMTVPGIPCRDKRPHPRPSTSASLSMVPTKMVLNTGALVFNQFTCQRLFESRPRQFDFELQLLDCVFQLLPFTFIGAFEFFNCRHHGLKVSRDRSGD